MYSFLKAFLVLMKLLSLSQFYAPKKLQICKDQAPKTITTIVSWHVLAVNKPVA